VEDETSGLARSDCDATRQRDCASRRPASRKSSEFWLSVVVAEGVCVALGLAVELGVTVLLEDIVWSY